jgi:hypothetical protein
LQTYLAFVQSFVVSKEEALAMKVKEKDAMVMANM